MLSELSAHQFRDMYLKMGISTSHMGCIMLDVDSFYVTELVPDGEEDLYYSRTMGYVQGAVVENNSAHVTLLYGLLNDRADWKKYVDTVLEGWTPPPLAIESVGIFESKTPGEDYACIVAHIKVSDELLDGHSRLELLPHINTFQGYKPHLTLAYVKSDKADKWVKHLKDRFEGFLLYVNRINYGDW